MKSAVLGIGSPHGDDQIAWLLVDKLQQQYPSSEFHWEKVSAPVTSLVNQISAYDHILVIDAAEMGMAPGDFVFMQDAASSLEQEQTTVSSHAMGLRDSWQMAKALGMKLPEIDLFLVQLEQCEPMAPISEQLKSKIPDMLDTLEKIVSVHKTEVFSV